MTTHSLIRPFHPNDAEAYHTIVNDPSALEAYSGPPALEIGAARGWAKSRPPGLHRLVIEHDGNAIGFGMLQQYQNPRRMHSGALEWLCDPEFREAHEEPLLVALLDLADHWLNLRRVELQLIAQHEVAIQLVESLGFQREGTMRDAIFGYGRLQDMVVLSRLCDYVRPILSLPTLELPLTRVTVEVQIRTPRVEDAAAIHAYMHLPSVAGMLAQLPSIEGTLVEERISQQQPGVYRFVALVAGQVVGDIHLRRSDNPRMAHSAGFGLSVHPDFWGQGVGSRLMEAMLDLADQWLNLRRVWLEVYTDNPTAIRLYEKYGFEKEGTRRLFGYGGGRWTDADFMARLRPF